MESFSLITILFIVLIFIPGHFFKRFYYSGKFSRQFSSGDFAERLIVSLFWGVVVQLCAFSLMRLFIKFNIEDSSKKATSILDKLTKYDFTVSGQVNFLYCFYYLGGSLLFSILLGGAMHHIVRILKLDLKVNALRYTNEWHYFFTGGNLKSQQRTMGRGRIEAVQLDLVTDAGDGNTRLYSGLLNDYALCPEGKLDVISINGAKRYSTSKGEYTYIPGDCLVIPYDKVININISFLVRSRTPRSFTGAFAFLKNIAMVLLLLSIVAAPFGLPIAFYSKIGLSRTIGLVIVAELALICISTIVSLIFTPKEKIKNKKEVIIVLSLVLAICLLYCLLIFL